MMLILRRQARVVSDPPQWTSPSVTDLGAGVLGCCRQHLRPAKESATTFSFDLAHHVDGAIGAGAVAVLGDLVSRRRAVVVTDRHLEMSEVMDRVREVVGAIPEIVIEPGEPTTQSISALAGRLEGDEVVLAVGGGSVIDSAKLAAAVAGSSSVVGRHLLAAQPFTTTLKVVAVPTTAGAGAEVTRTCVVTDHGHKSWAWDEALRPASVVLDGDLTRGLPPAATVATGLDAIVHAMEAATAQTRDLEASRAALWALSELRQSLPAVVVDSGDPEARSRTLVASTAAGFAIDRCATGIGHGLGHALGSLAPIAHGLAVAFAVWVAADFNQTGGDSRANDVARALGKGGYADGFEELVLGMGLPELIAPIARARPLMPTALADEALAPFNAPMLANNIRPVSPDEAHQLAGLLADRWNRLGGHG